MSENVRAGVVARQRAENKRALSARAREREAARKHAERYLLVTLPAFFSLTLAHCNREQKLRDEEAAAARATAATHHRERVQFRDAEFQQKLARAAAAALEEEEEHRRRAAALQALADTVAPNVESDPRRVLQV